MIAVCVLRRMPVNPEVMLLVAAFSPRSPTAAFSPVWYPEIYQQYDSFIFVPQSRYFVSNVAGPVTRSVSTPGNTRILTLSP